MKKRMMMLFACLFTIAPAVLGSANAAERRANGDIYAFGQLDCVKQRSDVKNVPSSDVDHEIRIDAKKARAVSVAH